MAFDVQVSADALTVELSGPDRVLMGRSRVVIDRATVVGASVAERHELESLIDHRERGIGTHDGAQRPGRRRVGVMLGRSVVGRQFWAVATGPPDARVAVVDLAEGPFARAVLEVDVPEVIPSWATAPRPG